jgi:hypothetical protein
MHMKFGTWNVRIMYRVGSLITVSTELYRCRLDLLGVQEFRWEGGATEPAEHTLSIERGMRTINWVQDICA